MATPRFQFSLRFVLLWVVPYIALAATILAWKGTHDADREFLNSNQRATGMIILTDAWASAVIVRHFRLKAKSLKAASRALQDDGDGTPVSQPRQDSSGSGE